MKFDAKKCLMLVMRKIERRPKWIYSMGNAIMVKEKEEGKDLKVILENSLPPENK